MLKVILLAVVLVGIGMVLFAVRILFQKNGEFRGTCANNNPFMQKQGVSCGVCGKKAGEPCQNEDEEISKKESLAS
jgi:hypothetical protein